MKKSTVYFLFSMLVFAAVSCTDHEVNTVSEVDRQFMISAAVGNLFEIKAGELATKKAVVDSVKEYGHHMVMDHSMATQELMAVAAKKNVMLPTELTFDKQLKIDSLINKEGMEFDKLYMTMMVASHVETIKLFEMEAASGMDHDVRSFALGKLPNLTLHLIKAKELKESLK